MYFAKHFGLPEVLCFIWVSVLSAVSAAQMILSLAFLRLV